MVRDGSLRSRLSLVLSRLMKYGVRLTRKGTQITRFHLIPLSLCRKRSLLSCLIILRQHSAPGPSHHAASIYGSNPEPSPAQCTTSPPPQTISARLTQIGRSRRCSTTIERARGATVDSHCSPIKTWRRRAITAVCWRSAAKHARQTSLAASVCSVSGLETFTRAGRGCRVGHYYAPSRKSAASPRKELCAAAV